MRTGLRQRTPIRQRPPRRVREVHHLGDPGPRLTLDEVVSSAWAGLSAGSPVACPVCGIRMVPEQGPSGRCCSCSSTLS